MRLRRLLPLAVLGVCGACGKKPADERAISWVTSVETAEATALAEKKPVLVYVHASWDTGSKELENVTFNDPDVRALSTRYVMLAVDATDDEDRGYQERSRRFRVVGVPSLIVYGPDLRTELHRENSYIPPQQLASILQYADASGHPGGMGEVRARASYGALQGVLQAMRDRALSDPLMDPARIEPWASCYAKPAAEQPACLKDEEARTNRMNADHARLEHEVLPAILADSPVVSMHLQRSSGQQYLWANSEPTRLEQKLGTRNVEVGVDLGAGTTLGWGAYRTRQRYATPARGDDTLHPGIEVVYRTEHDFVKMVVLTDGFRRPADWR